MKFRFPIIIIDEDYRSENTSGLGIRALAQAIEAEGFEVVGVTSYGDLSQFAQQQSRASAFILSIDDEEFTGGDELDPIVLNLRHFIGEVRRKNSEVPIYVHGETVMIESWNADGTSSVKYRGANWVAIHRQGVQPSTGPHRVAELVGNRLLVDPL